MTTSGGGGRGDECTPKDLRVFFVAFLVAWMYSAVAFCHDLNKQFRWERAAGTVVDLRRRQHPRGGTYYSPEISFRPTTGGDDGSDGEEVTFVSAAEVGWYAAEHGAGDYVVGDEGGVVVLYDPRRPSRGPEALAVNRTRLMASGPTALFLTQIGLALGVYSCMTTDGGIARQLGVGVGLGLGDHLAPAAQEQEGPRAGGVPAQGSVVV